MDDSAFTQAVNYIDHRAVDWARVRRTRCQFYQRFEYVYPGPIRNLKQRLVVVPADRYGPQRLLNHRLAAHPQPAAILQIADRFGNRIMELDLPEADRLISFDVYLLVESALPDLPQPVMPTAKARSYLDSTRLTTPDAQIRLIARQLRVQASDEHDLARRISEWVYGVMEYASGRTSVMTTAAEALALGQGLCQDFAHIMIAICRTAGLPARYVSGHLLGEGGSHAWVEVLLPLRNGFGAFAFDPTNKRQPHLGYVTVAVGRDYQDVAPTSGSFTAPYGGQLTCRKRAGLTLVEYKDGETLRSSLAS